MQILNLTGARIKLPIGPSGYFVDNNTITDHLILTPELVRSSLLPLSSMYGDKLQICVNTSELGVFDKIGFPVENISTIDKMEKRLKGVAEDDSKDQKVPENNDNKEVPSDEPEPLATITVTKGK